MRDAARPRRANADPPAVPGFAVRRDRLIALLDQAVQRRVTLVVAPPGYGKTVLVSQWARAHRRARVRWLTLRPEHGDGSRLAEDLGAALGTRPPDPADAAALARLDGSRRDPSPMLLTSIRARLGSVPPTTLVLDDMHRLPDPKLVDELCDLVEHLPRWIHAVLVTRVDPPLHYHRLLLADEFAELRQDDLAFRSGEASELLRRLAGRRLADHEIGALVARTEGWAAGLQLAGVFLRGRPDTGRFVATVTEDDRNVADYLTEEVLNQQPDGVRRFLLSTCVLERMNGPLCDAVTGGAGGQAMLEELEHRSLFVAPLDPGREWFRYHHLFRSLLRHHLRAEDAARERLLLERAATWHLARGELETGVDYLVEAGAWDEVLAAASDYGGALVAQGRPATVARWIERVPRAARDGNVEALLRHAAASLMAGNTTRTDADLQDMEGSGQTAAQRVAADTLRALSAVHQGAAGRAVAVADRVLRDAAGVDDADVPNLVGLVGGRRDLEAAAQLARGMASLHQGDIGAARAALDAVLESGEMMWHVGALGSLALLEAWSGRLGAAEQFGTRALSSARELGLDQQPLATEAHVALATVARSRGEFGYAALLLDQAAGRAVPIGHPVFTTVVHAEQALVALESGRPADGLATLRRHGIGRSDPPSVDGRRRAAEARVRLAIGDIDGAVSVLGDAADDRLDVVAARLRLAVERGDVAESRALIEHWPSEPRPRATIERDLWLAILDHGDGKEAAARERFASVVSQAAAEWDLGLFRSAGRHVLGPARPLYRSSPSPFLRAIVHGASAAPASQPLGRDRLVEPLTERESVLLALLPTRLSNAEIADRLGVSVNTVKTHAKHVYRKLGVTGRSEAVATAERMHLI